MCVDDKLVKVDILVLRPSVFDCLQYVKTEGKGLGFLTMWSVAQTPSQVLDTETHSMLYFHCREARETRQVPAEKAYSENVGQNMAICIQWQNCANIAKEKLLLNFCNHPSAIILQTQICFRSKTNMSLHANSRVLPSCYSYYLQQFTV